MKSVMTTFWVEELTVLKDIKKKLLNMFGDSGCIQKYSEVKFLEQYFKAWTLPLKSIGFLIILQR